MGRKKGVIAVSLIILVGNILVSLGFGPLSSFKIPWPSFTGMEMYGLYDWLDCFTGYLLLPLGCLLTCIFIAKIWGFDNYEKELFKNGEGKLNGFDKMLTLAVIPIFMVIVLLNVFGFLG